MLDAMDRVVRWAALVALVSPDAPQGKTARPPFLVEAMLRIHFLQQWFGLGNLVMEEAPFPSSLQFHCSAISASDSCRAFLEQIHADRREAAATQGAAAGERDGGPMPAGHGQNRRGAKARGAAGNRVCPSGAAMFQGTVF